MPLCRFYPLATVLCSLPLYFTVALPAPAKATTAQPQILIASIQDKVQEYISKGNSALAEGNPDKLKGEGLLSNGRFLIGDNARAIKYFDDALRLDPKNRDALYGRGLAHLQAYVLKDEMPNRILSDVLREAIDNLGQVTRMQSAGEFAPVYLELGRALLLNGEYDNSIKASMIALKIKKGVTIKNKAWRAHSNIASAHYQLMLQDPSQPNGPKHFESAEAAWQASTKLNPDNVLAYEKLAQMHRYAHEKFGYPQASLQKAASYANEAKLATQRLQARYEQSPEGQRDRAERQRNQQLGREQAIREQQAQARLEAWRNRPCTPYGDALRRHMCQEGYLHPQSEKGRNQPMPEDWQP
jgi:tetratricopeptide (TPR) repeat protein